MAKISNFVLNKCAKLDYLVTVANNKKQKMTSGVDNTYEMVRTCGADM